MPILNIRLGGDPLLVQGCIACKRKATAENPIIVVDSDPTYGRPIYSHLHCPPAVDRRRRDQELSSRNASSNDNIWEFASVNKYAMLEEADHTIEQTVPKAPGTTSKPEEMTNKQVDANYDSSGTPVPPKN